MLVKYSTTLHKNWCMTNITATKDPILISYQVKLFYFYLENLSLCVRMIKNLTNPSSKCLLNIINYYYTVPQMFYITYIFI